MGSCVPFHWIWAAAVKFDPLSVSLKEGPAAVMEDGDAPLMEGVPSGMPFHSVMRL